MVALGCVGVGLAAQPVHATQVWNGPLIQFSEPSSSDGTQPQDQDQITTNVWLTRGLSKGLFNAAQETSYAKPGSPLDTEWAYGELANWSSLTYQPWVIWNGANPPSMVGQDAVLHLISEDIYLSVTFLSWGQRTGGFSYLRSTQDVPEASPAGLALGGLVVLVGAQCLERRARR